MKRIWLDLGPAYDSFYEKGHFSYAPWEGRPSIYDQLIAKPEDLAVIAVEANADFYNRLLSRPNIKYVIPCALPKHGMIRFYHFLEVGCSSSLGPNKKLSVEMPSEACTKVVRRK